MSALHYEILDRDRQKIFQALSVFQKKAYLAGGTALALQLNHRLSFDFDLFFKKSVSVKLVKKLEEVLKQDLRILRQSGDHIALLTPNDIKIDLVSYWHPLLTPSIATASIDLASTDDIAADKTVTIGRRGQWRDYVDLFFLLKKEILTLEKIMALAKKKFQGEFNELLFLEQLKYHQDLKMTKIIFIDRKYSEKQIKDCLSQEVSRFLKKELPQIG